MSNKRIPFYITTLFFITLGCLFIMCFFLAGLKNNFAAAYILICLVFFPYIFLLLLRLTEQTQMTIISHLSEVYFSLNSRNIFVCYYQKNNNKLKNKETKLYTLQTQINSHFIYNSLEIIRMTAVLKNDDEIAQMILILSKLLRYNVFSLEEKITLRQEVEHLRNYILMQNYQRKNNFELVINVEDSLWEMRIVKLLLQPIVENGIFHGMSAGNGQIYLNAFTQDDIIVGRAAFIDIRDTGNGINTEKVEELNKQFRNTHNGSKVSGTIGLRNTNERIKLYYGEEYGLKIISVYGKGTVVSVKLPAPDFTEFNQEKRVEYAGYFDS